MAKSLIFILIFLVSENLNSQTWVDSMQLFLKKRDFERSKSIYFENMSRNNLSNDTASLKPKILLGNIYMSQNNFDSAIIYFNDAINVAKINNYKSKQLFFIANNNIGICYERLGIFSTAEKYYNFNYNNVIENIADLYSYFTLSIANLAGVLIASEKYADAEKLLKSNS